MLRVLLWNLSKTEKKASDRTITSPPERVFAGAYDEEYHGDGQGERRNHERMYQRATQAEQVGEAHEDHAPDQEYRPENGGQSHVGLQGAFLSRIRQLMDPLS